MWIATGEVVISSDRSAFIIDVCVSLTAFLAMLNVPMLARVTRGITLPKVARIIPKSVSQYDRRRCAG